MRKVWWAIVITLIAGGTLAAWVAFLLGEPYVIVVWIALFFAGDLAWPAEDILDITMAVCLASGVSVLVGTLIARMLGLTL